MRHTIIALLTVLSVAAAPKESAMTYPVQQITQSIQASPESVYQFTSNPENLPKWASGLSRGIKKVGADWVAESPMGQVKVKFSAKNDFGVLDHEVTLPSGVTMSNPLRVVKNHEGSEVVFTLFRRPETSDKDFAKDAATVAADLKKLKSVIEKGLLHGSAAWYYEARVRNCHLYELHLKGSHEVPVILEAKC